MNTPRHQAPRWIARYIPAALAACATSLAGCASNTSSQSPPEGDSPLPLAPNPGSRPPAPARPNLRLTSVMPREISGRLIAVINDVDVPATVFHDKKLAPRPRADTATDQLTVVSLPIREPVTPIGQVAVSNSAFGPPQAMALNPDATRAYIAETRGPAGPNAITSDDLPAGRWLTAVDITNPESPKVVATLDLGAQPSGLDVSPDGRTLVVCTNDPEKAVILIPLTPGAGNAEFGTPHASPLLTDQGFNPHANPGAADTASHALRPSGVQWAPDARHIAVTLPDHDHVVFYEVTGVPAGPATARGVSPPTPESDQHLALRKWGEPVRVGRYPYSGRFTPDGKHFITTDLHWEPGMDGFLVEAPAGTLSVIEVAQAPTHNPDSPDYDGSRPIEHRLVAQSPVGVSPEAMAISPDGRHVVTANLQRSFLPDDDERLTPGGSLSLLTRDAATGQLTPVREFSMDAMPEGIGFDQTGRHVVVSQFRSFDPRSITGEIAFWRLFDETEGAGTPFLQQCNFVVGVGPGPHGVLVVR